AVAVQQGLEYAAACLACLGAFLAEQLAEAARVEALGAAAFGQEGQHDRRQHRQQLHRLAAAKAGGLAQALCRARLGAAEDVAEDRRAIGLAAAAAPPSTAPSRPPRSGPAAWSRCRAPNRASAPWGWALLRPSAPSSSGRAVATALPAWSWSVPSWRAICCMGAPCNWANSSRASGGCCVMAVCSRWWKATIRPPQAGGYTRPARKTSGPAQCAGPSCHCMVAAISRARRSGPA